MTSLTAAPDRSTKHAAGDVVTLDGARFELLSDPFLGMTGASMFDAPALFWRARARRLGAEATAAGYVTWVAGPHPTN